MARLLVCIAAIVALLVPALAPAQMDPSGTTRFTLPYEGKQRTYLLHLPTGYRSGTPMPVVFALHGGGDMKYMASDRYALVAKADSAGFIAVFPNGYSRFPGGRLATWNAGTCCGAARDTGSDDVGFVRAILAQLPQHASIDTQRIFATGMSNDGMMSYRLACEMADVFKAIASVAGTDNTVQCKPSRTVSVLHIHAKDDTHVLFNGGAGADAFRDKSQVTEFVSVPRTVANWVQRNQCTGAPRRVLTAPGAICDVYASCAADSQIQLCVTETGGHSWPGGKGTRPMKPGPSSAVSANDVMWDFFQRAGSR